MSFKSAHAAFRTIEFTSSNGQKKNPSTNVIKPKTTIFRILYMFATLANARAQIFMFLLYTRDSDLSPYFLRFFLFFNFWSKLSKAHLWTHRTNIISYICKYWNKERREKTDKKVSPHFGLQIHVSIERATTTTTTISYLPSDINFKCISCLQLKFIFFFCF